MVLKRILKTVLKLLWVFPVNNRRIIFRSTHGTKYNCNPKYICEYILDKYTNKYEIVWLFDKSQLDSHQSLQHRGIKVLNQKSFKGIFAILTAKVIIDNHGIMSYIPLRKEQIIINTWHGGGSYKREHGNSTEEHKEYMKMMYESTSAFISSCKKFSMCNLSILYNDSPEKIMEIGMPRNDIFFEEHSEIAEKVKEALHIDKNKKIVLYAPTFRYEASISMYMLDAELITQACSRRFGGDFVFATRVHPFVEKRYKELGDENTINTNEYEDMQELLYACDVLITDYSSCMWDVSLNFKPCFIYAADLEYYEKNRSFHTPIKEWPFVVSETIDELVSNIESFDDALYKSNVEKHHADLGSFECGKARERIVEYITTKISAEIS